MIPTVAICNDWRSWSSNVRPTKDDCGYPHKTVAVREKQRCSLHVSDTRILHKAKWISIIRFRCRFFSVAWTEYIMASKSLLSVVVFKRYSYNYDHDEAVC